jgi:hypothetical protein
VCILSLLRPDQEVDLGDSRTRPEQLLQEHFAHEAGAAGDEDSLPAVELADADVRRYRVLYGSHLFRNSLGHHV